MMHCWACGADFREPALYAYRENLDDENWVITTQTVCPYCGTDNIMEEKDEDAEDIDARHEPRRMA